MDVVSFQRKWIGASNLKERTASQSHFNDLCDLLGVPKPTDIDHTGETYTFERGASITAAGNGWADVWMKGHFAWEYKGQGKNLDDAYVHEKVGGTLRVLTAIVEYTGDTSEDTGRLGGELIGCLARPKIERIGPELAQGGEGSRIGEAVEIVLVAQQLQHA